MEIMVDIEASIDYPEYDVEEVTNERVLKILEDVKESLIKLEKTFDNGKLLKDGIKVAIVGKPNAGKSSLLNAILKEDRAIVTEFEGTTRDTIEEFIQIDGIPLKIIDTAGIRTTDNEIEKIGINKAKEIAEEADLIIFIIDASRKLDEEDREILELIKNKNGIILLNKTDLTMQTTENDLKGISQDKPIIAISALKKEGIEAIYEEISNMYKLDKIEVDESLTITNNRHKQAIRNMERCIENAVESIKNKMPIDVISVHIIECLNEIGKITGESVSEDIIKEIFKKFCLGK